MTKKLKQVMLIDDDEVDNLYHKRILTKSGRVENIVVFDYAQNALEYLRDNNGETSVIFLDINMPRMNGFEFLQSYAELPPQCKATAVVTMLTTSADPQDFAKAKELDPAVIFHEKPLTVEIVNDLVNDYFSQ